jgi:uncharacterized protein involved in cysteine biosynthesis
MRQPPPQVPWANEHPVSAMTAIGLLFDGIGLSFSHAKVRKKALVGMAINAIVFLLLLAGLIWAAIATTAELVDGNLWEAVLGWLLRAAGIVLAAILAPVLFNLITSIVMPIFNSGIFEAARTASGGPPLEGVTGISNTESISLEIKRLIKGLGLLVLVTLGTFALSFIPIVNLITTPLGTIANFMIGASVLGWDLHSYHLEYHGWGYREQEYYVKTHRMRVLGVGAVALIMLMIPGLNLIFITTNVAGAGILSARLDGAKPNQRVP